MDIISFIRITAILIAIVGVSFLMPVSVGIAYGEYDILPSFIIPMIVSWILAAITFFVWRKRKIQLSTRGAFVVVASSWISSSLIGALPMYFSGAIPSFTDAFYESVSGFTTTGATILSEIESLPVCINFWRCEMHWLGGMGIVALTVALLPLLGVGGFQLIKAETTGPEKGKITPNIKETAKILWIIYVGFTLVQTILLMICGMNFIEAFEHSMSTLGTGGFSNRNSSIGAYNSVAIDIVCTVFMVLAGVNFSLYYYLFTKKFSEVKENSELKAYIAIIVCISVAIAILILPQYGNFFNALRYSSFHVASLISTTGFSTTDFAQWSSAAQFLLLLLYFIGGCSGSTGGGIKVVRWVVLFKQVNNETERMIHPHGVFSIQLNQRVGRKDIIFSVAAFIAVYFALLMITSFIGCLGDLDLLSSFTGALTMVGNVGPGFGKIGPAYNFGFLPSFVKWWYCFAMLAGRLELYTMIIFLMPAFWKK